LRISEGKRAFSHVALFKNLVIITINYNSLINGRNHFAFSDVRRLIAKAAADKNFSLLSPKSHKSKFNSLVTVLLRIAA